MDNFQIVSEDMDRQLSGMDAKASEFKILMTYYECAILEVKTKLDVLNNEFKATDERNPISTIKSRIKSIPSILEKLDRKGYPSSIESIQTHLDDVAGIRVICSFIDDIYKVLDMLKNQDDLKILSIKDYIKNPKKSGYRSLHCVVEIPIYLSNEKKPMRVEVQIRPIAMDFWACYWLLYQREEMAPIINIYEFDEALFQQFRYKRFEAYSEEWAHFVYDHRTEPQGLTLHDYDIVYGPIANDRIGAQITRFKQGYITFDEFMRRIQYIKGITFQYAFCTQRAIDKLEKIK